MSMLVCIVAQAAVYMAADSRQYPSGAGAVQKVFLAGRDAIVGHSGIGVIPSDDSSGGIWDAAKEVVRIAARIPVGTVNEQLGFIKQEALKSLNAGLLHHSGEINSDHPQLAIMFVKRDSHGRVYCAHEVFPVVSTDLPNNKWRHLAHAAPAEPVHTSGIWWEVPPECPLGIRRPEAPTYAAISAFINEVGGQSKRCRQLIGGPIRVGLVDDQGARWMSE